MFLKIVTRKLATSQLLCEIKDISGQKFHYFAKLSWNSPAI